MERFTADLVFLVLKHDPVDGPNMEDDGEHPLIGKCTRQAAEEFGGYMVPDTERAPSELIPGPRVPRTRAEYLVPAGQVGRALERALALYRERTTKR